METSACRQSRISVIGVATILTGHMPRFCHSILTFTRVENIELTSYNRKTQPM